MRIEINPRRELSVMKVAESSALYSFMIVSMLPVFVILAETLTNTIGAGSGLPPSFVRYVNRVTANTLYLAAVVTVISLLAGVPAGYFLARLRSRTAGGFLILLTIPLAAPSLVSAVMVRELLDRTGFLYIWMSGFAITMPSAYGVFGMAVTQLLHTIPYTILLTRAGFLAVPRNIEDSAHSLGAHPLTTFRDVILPFVFPHILTACTMIILYSLGDLGAPIVLGGPFKVFSSEIFVNFISNWGDKRVPLVFAVWAIAVFFIVLLVMARVKAHFVIQQNNDGAHYSDLEPHAKIRAIAYLVLLSAVLLLPFLFVVGRQLHGQPWAIGGLHRTIDDWSSVKSTLLLALFVVPPMLFAGILIANALKSRRQNVLATGIILAPAALPGVLLGFGLIRGLQVLKPVQITTASLVLILCIALIVRGMPYVVIVLQSAINASTIALEDSARSLGATSSIAFFTVTLPQIRPFLAVAAVVGVFACFTELSATLIIYPPGWQTMSMFIAYYMEEGFVGRAILMAILLLLMIEAMLVISGILSAKGARLIKSSGRFSRDRMVFLSAFAALEPDALQPKPHSRGVARKALVSGRWRLDAIIGHIVSSLRSLRITAERIARYLRRWRGSELQILKNENAMLKEELSRAMQRNLSMQINPHFFFNTLNTIVCLVQRDRDVAIGTIGKLSSLFRYALDASNSDTLPLAKEIENIRTYLEIEKMRFGDKLIFTLTVADELFRIGIPPFLIQPLVENSVKYGKNSDGVAYLFVSIQSERKFLVIHVGDYGCAGIGPDEIVASEGTGLRTVRQRAEALPGGSLRFSRNRPQGTVAELRLPLERPHGQDSDR